MSMLTLHGQVINVFSTPKGVNRKTGEEFGGQDRIQVMAENILQNGDKRIDLLNLTVLNPEAYQHLKGKQVSLPVGVFITGGTIQYYVPKGSIPQVEQPAKVSG